MLQVLLEAKDSMVNRQGGATVNTESTWNGQGELSGEDSGSR